MRDLVFGILFWSVLGVGGFIVVGPIEGIALWRIFSITGIAGFIHGYLTSESRHVIHVGCGVEITDGMIEAVRSAWDEELDRDLQTGKPNPSVSLRSILEEIDGDEPLEEIQHGGITDRHAEALRKFWSYPCSFGFEYHGTMSEDEMRAELGMPEHFDLYDTIGAAGWEDPLDE